MFTVAGGILLAFLALVVLFGLFSAFAQRPRIVPNRPLLQNIKESVETRPTGVEGLVEYLDARLAEKETELQRAEDHANDLKRRWADIEPTARRAIALVNSKLAAHGMEVILSPPDFFGAGHDAFGAVCKLHVHPQPTLDLPYSGDPR
jgi:hypothetical protein